MRDHLIETFRPFRNDGYTYAELVHLRAAGKDIPDHWLAQAKRYEDADAQAAALNEAIAADLAAAEKAREKELAEKDKRVLPKLNTMSDELTELKADAQDKKAAALAAVKEYRAAHRAAASKFGAIRRTVKDEYGDPVKDEDGNAQPGQVYAEWVSYDVYLKDERVTPPILAPEFDSQLLRGL